MISIAGYDLLNDGKDGIRYAWRFANEAPYIESAAFVNNSKATKSDICGYTTSVSAGCILRDKGLACKFCRTGQTLPFTGFLSEYDIAKQNVFMVLTDMCCDDHPELRTKQREFAYMGQGEPGFSYLQVRTAIEITNSVMRELGQKVYRHIFATCGIPTAIQKYSKDIQHFFTERVTLHFSLHATKQRETVMPIDRIFPYNESLSEISKIGDISNEKPCIGILLFNNFHPKGSNTVYSNSLEEVLSIIEELDSEKVRISLCEFNASPEVGDTSDYPVEEARKILESVRCCGFEAKLFSSFGQRELTACGLLGGKEPSRCASKKWIELDALANKLVEKHALLIRQE